MNLAVILVNWRNEEQTLRAARAVKAWSALSPHLLVIDNESTERSSRMLSSVLAPDELICSQVNLGYGGGNNLGIRRALAAKAEYILLLNSDAEISEAAVSHLLERLKSNAEISILGPVIYEGHGDLRQCLIGGRDIARYASTRIAARTCELKAMPGYPLHDVDYVSGTVFLARGSVFEEIGLLDEQYFFSGEIADFCKRARDRERRICIDLEVAAEHDTGQTPSHLRDTLYVYYSLRNRLLYVRKHHASEKMKYYARWAKAGAWEFGGAVKNRKMARARAILLALAHGFANRLGNQNAKFT